MHGANPTAEPDSSGASVDRRRAHARACGEPPSSVASTSRAPTVGRPRKAPATTARNADGRAAAALGFARVAVAPSAARNATPPASCLAARSIHATRHAGRAARAGTRQWRHSSAAILARYHLPDLLRAYTGSYVTLAPFDCRLLTGERQYCTVAFKVPVANVHSHCQVQRAVQEPGCWSATLRGQTPRARSRWEHYCWSDAERPV